MLDKEIFREFLNYLLIVILFVLAFLVIKPVVFSIIYGLLFAYLFYPLYKYLLSKIKNRSIASLIICLVFLIIIIIFFGIIIGILFSQLTNIHLNLQEINISRIIEDSIFISPEIVPPEVISSIATSTESAFSSFLTKTTKYIGDFILNFPALLLQILVFFLILFFSLKDGEIALDYFKSLSPLKKETQAKFFQHFKDITYSVLIGEIVVGFIQGLAAGIGYFIFQVPNALLLTVLTIIVGIIPIIGPALIWVPVDIYLFVINRTEAGIFLLLYGIFFISWIDAVIRPIIVSRRTQINPAIILTGMVGGVFVFGVIGLIIGPLILAYVMLVLEIYRKHSAGESMIFKKIKDKDYNLFSNLYPEG